MKKRIEGTNCFPTAHDSPVSTGLCSGLREAASKRKKSTKATAAKKTVTSAVCCCEV